MSTRSLTLVALYVPILPVPGSCQMQCPGLDASRGTSKARSFRGFPLEIVAVPFAPHGVK